LFKLVTFSKSYASKQKWLFFLNTGWVWSIRYAPARLTLTIDRFTLKLVCESHLRWGTFLPNFGTLGLWLLDLFDMYATDGRTDRQTDGRTKATPIVIFPTVRGMVRVAAINIIIVIIIISSIIQIFRSFAQQQIRVFFIADISSADFITEHNYRHRTQSFDAPAAAFV